MTTGASSTVESFVDRIEQTLELAAAGRVEAFAESARRLERDLDGIEQTGARADAAERLARSAAFAGYLECLGAALGSLEAEKQAAEPRSSERLRAEA